MNNPIKAAAFQILLQVVCNGCLAAAAAAKKKVFNKHKFIKFSYFQGRGWELLASALILCCQYCSGAESHSASVCCFLSFPPSGCLVWSLVTLPAQLYFRAVQSRQCCSSLTETFCSQICTSAPDFGSFARNSKKATYDWSQAKDYSQELS